MSTRAPATNTVTARRFDVGGPLLRSFRRDSDGALLLEGYSSCETILEYRQPDGSVRRELVTREALLDSARTICRAPVTLEHPAEGFVTDANAKRLMVGDVDGEAQVEEVQGGFGRVRVRLAVRTAEAIQAVLDGKRELSEGYEVTLDPTPGEHPILGPYDARQIGRKTNHLALVDVARAGPGAHVRVDAGDAWTRLPPLPEEPSRATPAPPPTPSPSAPADSARKDHQEVRMNPTLVALLTALGVERLDSEDAALREGLAIARRRRDEAEKAEQKDQELEETKQAKADAEAEKKALQEKVDELTEERDKLKEQLDELKAEMKQKADAAELTRLQGIAAKVGVKADGLDLPKLRLALAKSRVDSVDDKTPAERIDGILDVIERDVAKGPQRQDSRWAFPPAQRQDAQPQGEQRLDEMADPWFDMADKVRKGGAQ